MAPAGTSRRHRSSTAASRGLDASEQDSLTAELVRKLREIQGLEVAGVDDLEKFHDIIEALRRELATQTHSSDTFRHAKGFEATVELFRHRLDLSQSLNLYIPILQDAFLLLRDAIGKHRGNDKYFSSHLTGWDTIQDSLNNLLARSWESATPGQSNELMLILSEGLLNVALGEDAVKLSDQPARDVAEGAPGIGNQTIATNDRFSKEILQNPLACAVAVRLAIACLRNSSSEALITLSSRTMLTASKLARLSARNAVSLWQTGILTDLLPLLEEQHTALGAREEVFALIDSLAGLGSNSLDDAARLFKWSIDSNEIRRLLLSTLQKSKVPGFIQFDMAYCGYSSVELPCLPRAFPPSSGYSVSAWIRIDEFDAACHTTLFGAFDASQSCFVLMYLEKDSYQLILQTSIRSSRPSVRFKSTRFEAGAWYHLALVHKLHGPDPRQSSAALFLNGEFREQVKCAYPDIPPEHTERQTSSTSPGQSSVVRWQRPVQAFFGTPHDLGLRVGRNEVMSKWSLASGYLHQTPLTDEFIAVQHRLGPRYVGNYQDCLGPLLTYRASAELNRYNELLHPDKSDKSDIVTATEARGSEVVPESKLLISLLPSAIIRFDGTDDIINIIQSDLDRRALARYQQLSQKSRAIAINAAVPTLNEAVSRSYGCCVLTGDPVVAIPKALDDASWSLAGSLPALLGLLEFANSKVAFLESVQIFFECVRDNWRISEGMEKGNGFGILAALIREKLGFENIFPAGPTRKPTQMLSLDDRQSIQFDLLRLILDFVGYDQDRPEHSMIINPMAYRVLLLDFDTWRRCDLPTQKLYYAQFVHFVSHNQHQAFNLKRLVRMRVMRKMVEALKAEEFALEILPSLIDAMRVLLDNTSAGPMYRDLAMFVTFGLQDERSTPLKSMRSIASIANLRQRTAAWARSARGSRPDTPGSPQLAHTDVSRSELAIKILELLARIICEESNTSAIRRFNRAVPNRWLLHLLAEPNVRVVSLTVRMMSRLLYALGQEFKGPFLEKNGGFITLKVRLKTFWRHPSVWEGCFGVLLGQPTTSFEPSGDFTVFNLVSLFGVDEDPRVANPEILPAMMSMLESGLRDAVKTDEPEAAGTNLLKTVIQLLSELYNRSANFRNFANTSRYVQELLFVLYPILVGSDRLSAEMELQSDKNSLSFEGVAVQMRPHSNSLGERPPSVRSLNLEDDKRAPSPRSATSVEAPKRLSPFLYIQPESNVDKSEPAHFQAVMVPKQGSPVKLNVGNSIVEALMEVAINMFIDQICNKEKFNGIGLFLKVPPGFREHQAYFESYLLVHNLTHLWHHLQLDQRLLLETRVITNLSRFCQHLAEAVFEGWFIDGAQPLLDFAGKLLEYLQNPDIASIKSVRLCSQNINTIRVVFLRVCLWRLSELDDSEGNKESTSFLNKMDYWQTILFATENQETLFTRLICFLLYLKLISEVEAVRYAATRLWRTILVQKPTETATLLTQVMGTEQRHLSTGFMKLVSMDDQEFMTWVDENRPTLDRVFMDALHNLWDEFVADENRRTEDSAKNRLAKRRERLRAWQLEESNADDFMHRYEISTNHWRSNVHSQERIKLQRSNQDHQENVNHLHTVFAGIEKLIRQPSGLSPVAGDQKWQLDETEAVNRMRLRTKPETSETNQTFHPKRKASDLPSHGLAIDTNVARRVLDDNMSPLPSSPQNAIADGAGDVQDQGRSRDRSDSVSNSQLLEGGFEMVEDPREADDGILEDKNRKVLTSLQRGDMVQQLYNTSRIVGLEACEGLLVVGKKCLYLQDSFFQRSDGEIVSVAQAPEDERDPYVQLISGKDVGGRQTKHSFGDQETQHWTWAEVLSISKRRFLFRDVSVEVFFSDGRSYLLTCMSGKVRDDLYSAIITRAPHVHNSSSVAGEDAWRLDTLRYPEEGPQSFGSKFASVFNSSPSHAATKKWIKGEMSNFQYLMLVNTMAGRTFNDLTQYPVFPWVLADYTSDTLDLDDPLTFRDFSKPMGCQTVAREAEYKDRFRQFAEMGDQNSPPFHYGTHYSSAMIVSSYLIRLQPFVQSYLLLQGGNFDHADRLFDSIERAWSSCSKDNMTDVRELTPEFFYLPEFLININRYDFGEKQAGGGVVNDVQLPPWAKGDPHIFIAKNREALESPYVSEHLHQWIDLVFGYKQRGEAAVEATNVFQHLSYQGAKDLDSIDDPVERLASIGIIHSFGQTPHQVFQRPHPAREQPRATTARLDSLAESLTRLPDPLFESDEKITGLTFSMTQERLLCTGPCKLNMLPDCDRFAQWDFADHSLRFFSANTKRPLGLFENLHVGPITAATFADSKILVTAGSDSTVALWGVTPSRDSIAVQPKTYLFGHRTAVAILAASRVFSTLLSASVDGNILIWGLNRQQSIRVLRPAGSPMIQAARISNVSGHILICEDQHLLLFTLNGHLLLKQKVCDSEADRLVCCAFYEGAGNEWQERELIFTGHTHGVANVWVLTTLNDGSWYLLLIKRLMHTDSGREGSTNASAAITAILPMPQGLYTGDEDGRVWEWDCVVRHSSFSARGR